MSSQINGEEGVLLTCKLWLTDLEKQTAMVRAILASWAH